MAEIQAAPPPLPKSQPSFGRRHSTIIKLHGLGALVLGLLIPQVTLSGKFAPPDFGALKIDMKDVQWKDAFVTIAVNDLRGTREGLVLDWGGMKRPMLPGSQVPGYTTGATAAIGGDQAIGSEVA